MSTSRDPIWQRTVLLASDSNQSIIAEVADGETNTIAYTAYGEQSAQQDVATRLGFNGQLREARIGWYLLGNGYRAYNPRLMRFHSPDSWSPFGRGGLNLYMYCAGEPVMNSDPTGHIKRPWPLVGKFARLRAEFHSPNYVPDPVIINPVTIERAASAMRTLQKDLPQGTPNKEGVLDAMGGVIHSIEKNRRIYPLKSGGRAGNRKEKTASRNQRNTPHNTTMDHSASATTAEQYPRTSSTANSSRRPSSSSMGSTNSNSSSSASISSYSTISSLSIASSDESGFAGSGSNGSSFSGFSELQRRHDAIRE
ncbi:RHS repeat-associated core domain-containing protein [Pseudomonas sp. Irchel s3h17]|uniref:RHS repeat-associated core domain-containing protein n=1 Tax=Pseudomonas sp. Irchel s3h17 TaxID=2009182 RepID=UPI00155F2A84|nr:RHS repeat-associated core domain-containing protein [Pseudomonas sp. Irchel s3h17]